MRWKSSQPALAKQVASDERGAGAGGSVPTVKQHLAAIRSLCDWLVVHQVLAVNLAAGGAGPEARRDEGRDAGADAGGGAGASGPD